MRPFVEWLDWVGDMALTMGDTEEQPDPRLVLALPDETVNYYLLHMDAAWRGNTPSLVRTLVGAADAVYAALIMESYRTCISKEDPRFERIKAGDLRVSDLPPGDRDEVLVVFGQDRLGTTRFMHWRIDDVPGAARRYTKLGDDSALSYSSRYLPLFVYHAGMDPPFALSAEEARKYTQRACKQVLEKLPLITTAIAETWPTVGKN